MCMTLFFHNFQLLIINISEEKNSIIVFVDCLMLFGIIIFFSCEFSPLNENFDIIAMTAFFSTNFFFIYSVDNGTFPFFIEICCVFFGNIWIFFVTKKRRQTHCLFLFDFSYFVYELQQTKTYAAYASIIWICYGLPDVLNLLNFVHNITYIYIIFVQTPFDNN